MTGAPGYHAQTQANLARIEVQLDALVDITSTQNTLAKQMGQELIEQNVMTDGLVGHMETTKGGIEKATKVVKDVKTSGTTWFAWGLVILIVIAVVLIAIL
jgi:t-SNARE complex subunit (syntaxin)